jgi:hypothetical protein
LEPQQGEALVRNVPLFVFICFALGGCATYRTTLTNAKGETITCEASGKSGIITGYYLRKGFNDCVEAAKQRGFEENK